VTLVDNADSFPLLPWPVLVESYRASASVKCRLYVQFFEPPRAFCAFTNGALAKRWPAAPAPALRPVAGIRLGF